MFESSQKRTLYCGDFTNDSLVEQNHTVNGWVLNYRDHGDLTFIDVYDRSGVLQLVFDPTVAPEAHTLAKKLRHDDVISAKGILNFRGEGFENDKIPTGKYELKVNELNLLNKSKTPPFLSHDESVKEDVRLKYRFVDIRRPEMMRHLIMKHRVSTTIRNFLNEEGFMDVETPILNKSTPEGARDFLVPSRLNPGEFYALPQSPQIFKQILMVSGVDRYYQFARCFRDEDSRADRQLEFTQVDLEMSFITKEDILNLAERMFQRVLKENYDVELKVPFPRMDYQEAMDRFGCDKPDTRFELELVDVVDVVKDCEFKVFNAVLQSGGMIKCLAVPDSVSLSRKDLDDLTAFVSKYGAKGMAWMRVKDGKCESNIVKYFSDEIQKNLIKTTDAKDGYTLLFIGDKSDKVVYDSISNLRLEIGERFGLIDKSKFNFLWVLNFPLFEWNEEEKRFESKHHPFTSPDLKGMELSAETAEKVGSNTYDLVLNGVELCSGSIRIHDGELQSKVFELLNISPEEAQKKFGFLLDALAYGAPPHGGAGFGLDRMVMEFEGLSNIRDVIAFPKTQKGQCLMSDAPSQVESSQLQELNLKVFEYKANK